MQLDLSFTWQAMPRLLEGAAITLMLACAAMVLSLALGTAVTIARAARVRFLQLPIRAYISAIRGTPLLVQILVVYYALPAVGIDLPPVVAGILALGVSSGAFTAEILRGGLAAIPDGQVEAGRSLGLPAFAIWTRVVMPQLFRLTAPPLVNEMTLVIKGTALVSVITVVELMRVAQQIYNANFRPAEVLIGVALIYFAIIFTLSRAAGYLDRRLALAR